MGVPVSKLFASIAQDDNAITWGCALHQPYRDGGHDAYGNRAARITRWDRLRLHPSRGARPGYGTGAGPVFRLIAPVLQLLLYLADPLIGTGRGNLRPNRTPHTLRHASRRRGLLTVFVGVALLITWAARQMPENHGILATIIANVQRAQSED